MREADPNLDIFSKQANQILGDQSVTDTRSIMYPTFWAAQIALQDVLRASDEWMEKHEQMKREREPGDALKRDLYGYGSNVIAFCAPRGQGKTSAMLSFAHALENSCQVDTDDGDSLWRNMVGSRRFFALQPIDPTILDKNESVIGLILARLFHEISACWKKQDDMSEAMIEARKMEILKDFQTCRQCLARHRGIDQGDLTDFIKSSNILEVKECLYRIVTAYFELKYGGGKRCCLIIQLDDTDMDMKNAYDVLEDVRKFLSIPQTVVLMATYLRQLRTLVAKHYEQTLTMKDSDRAFLSPGMGYTRMATKYIDKLIPAPQMIHINSYHHQRDIDGKVKLSGFLKKDVPEKDDLEEYFFKRIRDRTGLCFVRQADYVHHILPTSLRGLSHLYRLLEGMKFPDNIVESPDMSAFRIEQADERTSLRLSSRNQHASNLRLEMRNLTEFEDYFRNDWCYSKLDEKSQEIMWEISQAQTFLKLRIIENLLFERERERESARGITTGTNVRKEEPDFFDIYDRLHTLTKNAENMDDLMLAFAISTHLSIHMHKLYLSEKLTIIRKWEERMVMHPNAAADFDMLQPCAYTQLKQFLRVKDQNPQDAWWKPTSVEMPRAESLPKDKRIELLYDLIFRLNEIGETGPGKDTGKPGREKADSKVLECLAQIQDAAFGILGNADILSLWLETNERVMDLPNIVRPDDQSVESLGSISYAVQELSSALPKVREKTPKSEEKAVKPRAKKKIKAEEPEKEEDTVNAIAEGINQG